jgi:BirA family transcriptional regulator, biotin operon repressor / biotin---[acetyl-CoA-carboxylase] ligase
VSSGHDTSGPEERRPYALGRLRGEVFRFASLGSTNAALRSLAERGAPEGTVVVADEQTAGRGRHGRAWNSPAGAGFYGSLLLRPPVSPPRAQLLTLLAAVAAAEALAALGAPAVEVKWPNDVLVGGGKACGILNETGLLGEAVDWVVLGIGVNLTDEAIPPEVAMPATSLAAAGVAATAAGVTDALLAAIDRWYERFLSEGDLPLLDRWRELAPMAEGRRVTVATGSEVFEGTTDGLTPSGFLRVLRDGRVVELSAGDVSLRSSQ